MPKRIFHAADQQLCNNKANSIVTVAVADTDTSKDTDTLLERMSCSYVGYTRITCSIIEIARQFYQQSDTTDRQIVCQQFINIA